MERIIYIMRDTGELWSNSALTVYMDGLRVSALSNDESMEITVSGEGHTISISSLMTKKPVELEIPKSNHDCTVSIFECDGNYAMALAEMPGNEPEEEPEKIIEEEPEKTLEKESVNQSEKIPENVSEMVGEVIQKEEFLKGPEVTYIADSSTTRGIKLILCNLFAENGPIHSKLKETGNGCLVNAGRDGVQISYCDAQGNKVGDAMPMLSYLFAFSVPEQDKYIMLETEEEQKELERVLLEDICKQEYLVFANDRIQAKPDDPKEVLKGFAICSALTSVMKELFTENGAANIMNAMSDTTNTEIEVKWLEANVKFYHYEKAWSTLNIPYKNLPYFDKTGDVRMSLDEEEQLLMAEILAEELSASGADKNYVWF